MPLSLLAQPERQPVRWQARSFSEEKLAELEQDERLKYPKAKVEDSWWTKFKAWFFMKLAELFSGASRNGLLEIIVYFLCAGLGAYLIFRFLDIDPTSFMKRSSANSMAGMRSGLAEDIHAVDFEKEIAAAVQQQEYKKAIRLLYLASLKQLTDSGLLHWEPGKTNSEYQRELRTTRFTAHFSSLGYYFEYAWYGDFPVNEQLYQQVARTYHQFKEQLEVQT